ncbi:MAG: EAL domain-containing protein [Oscillospiraceae bacterium]|jgi:EAL domain-containing protein (putative c-di-GMP-specific phosphodiesterase class I)/ABC-type amino acid transport substrate-binding protein/GGDEF domain-containing protein|nr:EAL domain-containing protein [Oscillospiraceae bacterium]MCI9394897.1 EAL domain-containing protein [Oscillospiraceae bacterium]MCI9581975.1 EAL domain-containing protein [Oscillospiraceae bacterium]
MKQRILRQGLTALLCFVLPVCLLLEVLSGTAFAKDRRTVKVAFFPMEGYHEKKENGKYAGMDVEYLEALCRYTDWEIKFVECASWDEALQLVAQKKADLVGSAQYSAQRAASYQYADLSSGYTFGVIAARGDSDLAYEDFKAMQHITFGMVETYVRQDDFYQYLSDNGVQSPRVRRYSSTQQLQQALDRGEIDAMVHTFMEIQEGQRLIGRFAPRPFYYISYLGNDDVMRELNYGIADLKMNEPELETRLMNEFFQSRLDKSIVFTTQEKEYIASTGPVKVGYFDRYYPFVYEEDGTCHGLTRQLLENAAAVAGLSLDWIKVETPEEANQALADGTIDVMSYCVHTDEEVGEVRLVNLKEYTQIPLVLVMEKNKDMHSIRTLATVAYLYDEVHDVVSVDDTNLLIFNTQQECMDAVKDGKADAVLCDGYLAEYQLSAEMRYYNLEIKRVLNQQHGISMTVRASDTQLTGILNKSILSIDARAVSDYMLERNVYSLTSVSQFVEDNSNVILAILLLLMLGVILVMAHIIRDSQKIQKLMYKDVEIDIWNLNHLLYTGKKTLETDRSHCTYAIAYLNISQFQHYKVVYGWSSGQKLLESVADVLSQCVRGRGEVCAKAEGDHFVLMLSSEMGDILERLKNIGRLIEEYIFHDTEVHVELQMGVYFIPHDSTDLRGAMVCANQAIDFIRANSGDRIRVFDENLENAIKERHERQKLLDSVDIDSNFTAYYQAKVDVRTEQIVGAEALVRFMDPTAGGAVRSPGFFVPYYEQTGRIVEVDFFVLRCACQMLRRRLDQGQSVVTISCNFSRIHFTKPDFIQRFMTILEQTQIPRDLIEVEVTETLVMEEFQQKIAEQTLHELYELGIRLSIDDFGSGYSSLGVIEKIPAAVIKLDRSFLLNQEDRERQVKIMRRIVDLADDLGAQIVCEGVETDRDVELMREIGANVAQGYRYARPVPEPEFEQRLGENIRT